MKEMEFAVQARPFVQAVNNAGTSSKAYSLPPKLITFKIKKT